MKFSGQQYSANVFAQYFQDANVNPFLDEKRYPTALLENSDFGEKSWEISSENTDVSAERSEGDNLADALLENGLGAFSAPLGNDDWKEAAWQRKLRKQCSPRLGRRKH